MSSTIILKQQDFDTADRMLDQLDNAERNIARSFASSIADVRQQVSLNDLEALIQSGRVEEALQFIDVVPVAILGGFVASYAASGESTASVLARVLNIPIRFDQTNTRAVQEMQNSRLRLITNFNNTQRDAVRVALVDAVQRGVNPRQAAINFRDSIGLTGPQARAVINYRRLLELNSSEALSRELRDRRFDRTIQNAIANDSPLSSSQIDRIVQRYQDRSLAHRAQVIARTEALRSVHLGNEELYRQAFDNNTLAPTDLIRTWRTAGDSRVRDQHDGMSGQEQVFGSPFISDAGNLLRYPGDINAPASETIQCRCVITTRFT